MTQPTKRVTAAQLATLLVLEGQMANLQTAANQLGAFLGLKREAEICGDAIAVLSRGMEGLKASWDKQVQLASPSDMPPPSVIPSLERVLK